MCLLARREHSRHELRRKLEARGFDRGEIAPLLERLEREGLQSDARFTEAFAYHRAGKGYGPLRILHELRERGVEEGLAGRWVDPDASAWTERASQVRRKRFGGAAPADAADRVRQQRFLQYRGFTAGQIRSAFKEP